MALYFLELCSRQPGLALSLFSCVILDSPSQNQNYSESKMRLPEHSPYPGIQGPWALGFLTCHNPLQPSPSDSEPPACSISCLTRLLPLPEFLLPGLLCQGDSYSTPETHHGNVALSLQPHWAPLERIRIPLSCPPLGFRSLPSSLYL